MSQTYEALLLISFGGPESREDVLPFLDNVLRGKNVPRRRMEEVAEHYYHFEGVSPINEQNRNLIKALERELAARGPRIPIYWGNRNWHPLLTDTIRQMANDGVKRALAFVTSAYSSYSGCRQYREDIARACRPLGQRTPRIDKLRVFYNHPGFVEANVKLLEEAYLEIPEERRESTPLLFTAHSLPTAMAEGSRYVEQLNETAKLTAGRVGRKIWRLAYQSRSGPPHQPWLEPDVLDACRELRDQGSTDVVVSPIGFISDHMEVLYDLDYELRQECDEIGLNLVRTRTVGTHPRFVAMIRELILERMNISFSRLALGDHGASPDICPVNCCLPG